MSRAFFFANEARPNEAGLFLPLRMRIRPIDPEATDEIDLVAQRMRATLMEVVGQERGEAMYSLDWLRDRVRFHLDPQRSTAAVYLALEDDGSIAGHTIVRRERDEAGAEFGLFSTTYVAPEFRRRGFATALLLRGEAWMREQQLRGSATFTATDNRPLIEHYQRHGYALTPANAEMVRLARSLD